MISHTTSNHLEGQGTCSKFAKLILRVPGMGAASESIYLLRDRLGPGDYWAVYCFLLTYPLCLPKRCPAKRLVRQRWPPVLWLCLLPFSLDFMTSYWWQPVPLAYRHKSFEVIKQEVTPARASQWIFKGLSFSSRKHGFFKQSNRVKQLCVLSLEPQGSNPGSSISSLYDPGDVTLPLLCLSFFICKTDSFIHSTHMVCYVPRPWLHMLGMGH